MADPTDHPAPPQASSAGGLPVALVQLRAGEDGAANRRHAETWLERALAPRAGAAPPRLLMLMQRQSCTLLACPAAFNTTTGPRHWHLVLRARAVDTQCVVLACSSARPPDGDEGYPSYGHSLVVDPWGTVLAEAGIGEEVLHATLDLSQVALARQAIPTGVQRRTDLYRLSGITGAV